ncbi:MAG: NAD(P)H-dependent oxidoreductase [Clostridiales bacterium]|jgi:glutathione-regulated potassium-efflux system ancillary protein KefG|nr:NAD(P)H-dependent oxidoreductase [Clostridiales bacterium]
MNNLVIFGHPNLDHSMINSAWLKHLQNKNDKNTTIHVLCKAMKDGKFDVDAERKLILQHKKILVVYPFYWYNHPSFLQRWLEEVWSDKDLAFVESLRKVEDKQLMIAVTAAAEQARFNISNTGYFPFDFHISSWAAMANYIGYKFLPSYSIFEVYSKTPQQHLQACDEMWNQFLTAKIR